MVQRASKPVLVALTVAVSGIFLTPPASSHSLNTNTNTYSTPTATPTENTPIAYYDDRNVTPALSR